MTPSEFQVETSVNTVIYTDSVQILSTLQGPSSDVGLRLGLQHCCREQQLKVKQAIKES